MIFSQLRFIEYFHPADLLSNSELAEVFPEWPADKIEEKLGITGRPIARGDQCSSDLAVEAAEKLFSRGEVDRQEIDFVLFCTQTPDYVLPTSACLIQDRLKLRKCVGALDFNLGCSGYVYGLGLAKGLVETGQASQVLLLTGETYSKLLRPSDKSTRTLFGDAGSASIVSSVESSSERIGPFVYGSDGRGAGSLIVRHGGARFSAPGADGTEGLHMDGGEVFAFSLREVPLAVADMLEKSGESIETIDLFVFHQANSYMLKFLRQKCKIPGEKFYTHYADTGNTVSNTIPIALHHALAEGRIVPGMKVMLVGFGVGLSWAATIVRF